MSKQDVGSGVDNLSDIGRILKSFTGVGGCDDDVLSMHNLDFWWALYNTENQNGMLLLSVFDLPLSAKGFFFAFS